MSFCERITEKQQMLDTCINIYQQFVNEMNTEEGTNDIYRQALFDNIEKTSKMIFTAYKEALEIKAARDFNMPVQKPEQDDSIRDFRR